MVATDLGFVIHQLGNKENGKENTYAFEWKMLQQIKPQSMKEVGW